MRYIGASEFDHGLQVWSDYLAFAEASVEHKLSQAMDDSARAKYKRQSKPNRDQLYIAKSESRKRKYPNGVTERPDIRIQTEDELVNYVSRMQETDVICGKQLVVGEWSQDRYENILIFMLVADFCE